MICMWSPQTVPVFGKTVADSTILPIFGAVFNSTVFLLCVRGMQNSKED